MRKYKNPIIKEELKKIDSFWIKEEITNQEIDSFYELVDLLESITFNEKSFDKV